MTEEYDSSLAPVSPEPWWYSSCTRPFPPGRGREYRERERERETVLKVADGPPRGLQEHANVFHHNRITGASHMLVGDHKTSASRPAQVVECPTHPTFKRVVHDYGEKYRPQLETELPATFKNIRN